MPCLINWTHRLKLVFLFLIDKCTWYSMQNPSSPKYTIRVGQQNRCSQKPLELMDADFPIFVNIGLFKKRLNGAFQARLLQQKLNLISMKKKIKTSRTIQKYVQGTDHSKFLWCYIPIPVDVKLVKCCF